MLDDGAIGRGDPSVRHHFRDSVSDTMRITDLAAPRKIPGNRLAEIRLFRFISQN